MGGLWALGRKKRRCAIWTVMWGSKTRALEHNAEKEKVMIPTKYDIVC